ncbi:MAG: TRAP transporter large permease subunit, partial [Rhodobacteraceae bacterium]|nr:TRAP transporter large permease subunit [Paracoccaceae bacterium]
MLSVCIYRRRRCGDGDLGTESGAFGAIYAGLVTFIAYRSLNWQTFRIAVVRAVRTTSMVMILVACASAFAYMLTFYQVP